MALGGASAILVASWPVEPAENPRAAPSTAPSPGSRDDSLAAFARLDSGAPTAADLEEIARSPRAAARLEDLEQRAVVLPREPFDRANPKWKSVKAASSSRVLHDLAVCRSPRSEAELREPCERLRRSASPAVSAFAEALGSVLDVLEICRRNDVTAPPFKGDELRSLREGVLRRHPDLIAAAVAPLSSQIRADLLKDLGGSVKVDLRHLRMPIKGAFEVFRDLDVFAQLPPEVALASEDYNHDEFVHEGEDEMVGLHECTRKILRDLERGDDPLLTAYAALQIVSSMNLDEDELTAEALYARAVESQREPEAVRGLGYRIARQWARFQLDRAIHAWIRGLPVALSSRPCERGFFSRNSARPRATAASISRRSLGGLSSSTSWWAPPSRRSPSPRARSRIRASSPSSGSWRP